MDQLRGRSVLGISMIVWYLLSVGVLVLWVLILAPHFSYTLDDPYIHLALAQNIAHGHYGINAGEIASPASSILWPFLLAPFSRLPFAEWIPLVLNVLFSLGTCVVVGRFLEPRLRRAGFGTVAIVGLAVCVVMAASMPALTLTGMEHSLQVLLVAMCVVAILRAYEGDPVSWHYLAAAALAPAVRYEDVVYTGAVCAVLFLKRKQGTAIAVFLISLLPLIGLGLFLHVHGLPFFPNSVMAKGGVSASNDPDAHSQMFAHLLAQVKVNLVALVREKRRLPILLSLIAVVACAWMERRRFPALPIYAAALAAVAMILLGPYGWFFRYDVAIRVFLLLLALGLLPAIVERQKSAVTACIWLLALYCGAAFLPALIETPGASIQIARQQYQMHRLVQALQHENVAVNDIGWVSMNAYGRFYVLDLVGLANIDALRESNKDAAWLEKITRQHGVGLVMIYPGWFGQLPDEWQRLGVFHQAKRRLPGAVSGETVSIFATSSDAAKRLQPEIDAFRRTLPPGVWIASE